MPSQHKKAIVVGSGFGGLAAAIRLQTKGYDVEIVEKRDKPGGRAYVYNDNGFTFDAGPTVITAPHCLEELFSEAGRKMSDYIELMPVTPFYRLMWDDGYSFDYDASENMMAQIREKSPTDVQGYKDFVNYSKEVFQEGYEKLVHVPFLDMWSMVRVAPKLVKLKAYKSVYDVVSSFVIDDHLRQAFSFHSLLVGGNPFATSSIYTLIHYLERNWGVFFPRGGTGALIGALITLFKELGGTIRLNSPVKSISVDDKNNVTGVVLSSDEVLSASIVVSNSDVVHTYRNLLSATPVAVKRGNKLASKHHSMSLFLIYFGTKTKYENVAHHSVLFGPRYKGLLDDIFKKGVLPEDFSLYLHRPTATDAALAPEGCDAFYVLAPVAHLGKLDIDWSVEGPRYAETILKYLEKKCMPGLRENLVTQRIFTPADFKSELNAHLGSAFSLEPLLTQSAFFRVANRDPSLRGLYFVGAGTHPGAGVPGVINSAKATASLVVQDFQL